MSHPTATPTRRLVVARRAGVGPDDHRDRSGFDIRLSEKSIPAGSVTFEVVDEGSFPHNLVVEQDGEDVATSLQPGGTTTLTVDLQAGDYVLYCSVGDHQGTGMELPIAVS